MCIFNKRYTELPISNTTTDIIYFSYFVYFRVFQVHTHMYSYPFIYSHILNILIFYIYQLDDIATWEMLALVRVETYYTQLSTILFIFYIINCLFYLHVVCHVPIICCFRLDLIYIWPSSFLVQVRYVETDFKVRLDFKLKVDFKSGRCNQHRLATILLGTRCLFKGPDTPSCFLFLSSLDTSEILQT